MTKEKHAANVDANRNALALLLDGKPVRVRDEMLSLTDMWKVAGSDRAKRPVNWLDSKQAKELTQFLAETQEVRNSDLLEKAAGNPQTGDGGGTYAHWHLAMAYAKYLSPAFHIACNKIVRAHMESRVPAAPESSVRLVEALERFGDRLDAIERSKVDVAKLTHDVREAIAKDAAERSAADCGTIGLPKARWLLGRLRDVAVLRARSKGITYARARGQLETWMRDTVEHSGRSSSWSNLPIAKLGKTVRFIEQWEAEYAEEAVDKAGAARQGKLFGGESH
jgi:hypothetical protein